MGQVFMPQFKFQAPLRLRSDLHLARKFWHIMTGIVGVALYKATGVDSDDLALYLFGLSLAAFTVDFLRLRNESLNQILISIMKPFMRESERNSVSGLPFYALGVSLSFFLFPEKIALLATLFLIFADPIASFFGILYGKDKLLPNKSLQGTVAAFTVCYIITLFYGIIDGTHSLHLVLFGVLAGISGAISEMFSQFADDNLCIPVISGLGLYFINLFIPIF